MLEQHHFLELHLLEFLRVFQNYGCQDVQAETEVVAFVSQIRVEQPQADLHGKLPQEQAGYPLEVHVVEVDVLFLEVFEQVRVDSLNDVLDATKRFLYARPGISVVVEDSVEQFGHTVV